MTSAIAWAGVLPSTTSMCRGARPAGPLKRASLSASAPTASPAPPPSAPAARQPDDQQQDQCPDGGIDDRRHQTGAEMDAELRQQPAADECTDNSNNEIAGDTEPGA